MDHCYNFVVDARPVAMWAVDLRKDNDEFLRGIEPKFFVEHVDYLRAEVADNTSTSAAMHLRLLYAHAMETLFALVAAAAQAPDCPLAWILAYRPHELRSVVRKISERQLRLHRMDGVVDWPLMSQTINRLSIPDSAEEHRIRAGFADAWTHFAYEFVDEQFTAESNAIKHGLRVKPGGFTFTLGGPDKVVLDSRSVFGSRFYQKSDLGDRHNFTPLDTARNWNPEALAVALELLSVSIGNAVSYLRLRAGVPGPPAQFNWPSEPRDAFTRPFEVDFTIRQMSGGQMLSVEDLVPRTADEILDTYRVNGPASSPSSA